MLLPMPYIHIINTGHGVRNFAYSFITLRLFITCHRLQQSHAIEVRLVIRGWLAEAASLGTSQSSTGIA